MADQAKEPFNLEAGPLFRANLIRLSEAEHILTFVMHHIVTDGWSISILSRELGTLYESYLEAGEPPLPELPVQYADYAIWQREQLQGELLEEQLRYWREQLAGVAVLELPTDRSRPSVQSSRGSVCTLSVGRDVNRGLKELCKR
jgi:hypothetical protein